MMIIKEYMSLKGAYEHYLQRRSEGLTVQTIEPVLVLLETQSMNKRNQAFEVVVVHVDLYMVERN